MAETKETKSPEFNLDSDILAIRELIENNDPHIQSPATAAGRSDLSPVTAAMPNEIGDQASPNGYEAAPQKRHLNAVMCTLTARIKSYEPKSKTIILTSLVLLLILRPMLVLGWLVATVFLLLVCYFSMGKELFWRRFIVVYQEWAKRQPVPARKAKLWAYKFSKKWARGLSRLPDNIADPMRLPDPRQILGADAEHDAVVSDRLNRLRSDPSA